MRRLRAFVRSAIPPVLVLVMLPARWSITESFDRVEPSGELAQAWQEYRTFGANDNPWQVTDATAVRTSAQNAENSEVVALVDDPPPVADQQVSITVNALEVTPTDHDSWASAGVLARGSAEVGPDGVAQNLSAYNGELVLTDEFGEPLYLLLLWLVDDWDFGDPPEDVLVLASQNLGKRVDFPVRLTVRAQGTTITAFVVQDDDTTNRVSVTDTTVANGRVGVISSLVAPESARIEIDDFLAMEPPDGR